MEITPQHTLLIDIMKSHKGKSLAIKRRELLTRFNMRALRGEEITDRTIRKIKEECNEYFGQFILSDNEKGYWVANSLNDIVEYEQYYRSYVYNFFKQIEKVKANYANRAEKQEGLF